MEYKPIRARKIYEEVADSILERLKTGQLKSGDKLDSVEHMAKSYNVSRSAIREALSGLRAMGLVEMRQGEGTYITSFDASRFSFSIANALLMKRDDIKELMDVRKILEVGAAGLAALHHHEADLVLMEKALRVMQGARGEGEIGDQADLDFHYAIAHATKNQMLIHLMGSVSDIMAETMRETRRLIFQSEEGSTSLLAEHQQIFEAIKAKDFDQAQKYMFDHLNRADQVISRYIDS